MTEIPAAVAQAKIGDVLDVGDQMPAEVIGIQRGLPHGVHADGDWWLRVQLSQVDYPEHCWRLVGGASGLLAFMPTEPIIVRRTGNDGSGPATETFRDDAATYYRIVPVAPGDIVRRPGPRSTLQPT